MSDKRGLSESDICDRFLTPALERSGWQNTHSGGVSIRFLQPGQARGVPHRRTEPPHAPSMETV